MFRFEYSARCDSSLYYPLSLLQFQLHHLIFNSRCPWTFTFDSTQIKLILNLKTFFDYFGKYWIFWESNAEFVTCICSTFESKLTKNESFVAIIPLDFSNKGDSALNMKVRPRCFFFSINIVSVFCFLSLFFTVIISTRYSRFIWMFVNTCACVHSSYMP